MNPPGYGQTIGRPDFAGVAVVNFNQIHGGLLMGLDTYCFVMAGLRPGHPGLSLFN